VERPAGGQEVSIPADSGIHIQDKRKEKATDCLEDREEGFKVWHAQRPVQQSGDITVRVNTAA